MFLVTNIRIKDKEKFAVFSGMAGSAIKGYGRKLLAKSPDAERHEGDLKGTKMMIEFDSLNLAKKFYLSDEYLSAKAINIPVLKLI